MASLCLLLTGCGPYVLRGKVVQGSTSNIAIVHHDDIRLAGSGLAGAVIELTLDPRSLGRRVMATREVEPDGTFALPIEQFGAGLLEYEFGLVVRCAGHDSALDIFRLPGRGRRVLVSLARGPDRYRPREDPLKETRTFLRD